MKKILFSSLIVLMSLSTQAFSAPDSYFLMCVDCSQNSAKLAAKNHIKKYSDMYLEQEIYVYTNTGSEFGYSFMGNKEEWLSMAFPITSPTATKELFKGLHDYVEEYKNMITQTQAALDLDFLETHGFAKTEVASIFKNNSDEDCESSDTTGDSPFDYFGNNNEARVDSQINTHLLDYEPTSDVNLTNLGANAGVSSSGFSAGMSASMAVVNEQHVLTLTWGNGGIMRFVATQNAGVWGADLNLAGSDIGLGLYDGESLPGASLDMYVGQNEDGSYYIKGGTKDFANPCLERDFDNMVQALGLEVEIDTDTFAGLMGSLGGQYCGNANQTSNTYFWQEVQQTYTMVGNTMVISARIVDRSMTITAGSSHPCSVP